MKWFAVGFGVLALIVAAGVLWTEWTMAGIETPEYRVEAEDGAIEVRAYAPMLTASVTVSGTRDRAASRGFSPLAGFIFGDNRPAEKISMTAPVIAEPEGEAIDRAAPVITAPVGEGMWRISFVMPASYRPETLPAPTNDEIVITERPAERVAAIRFSGIASENDISAATDTLKAFMDAEGLVAAGPARTAFYDPPWRIPFLRRNEVIIPLT
ncbi:MAG: heme-binding protein [Pseudomonadota bacterium]